MRCSGGCVGVGCVYVQVRSIVLIVLKHCALHLPATLLTRTPAVSPLAIAGASQSNTVQTAPRFASTSAGQGARYTNRSRPFLQGNRMNKKGGATIGVCIAPDGAEWLLLTAFPTLKRGANDRCASGAIEIVISLVNKMDSCDCHALLPCRWAVSVMDVTLVDGIERREWPSVLHQVVFRELVQCKRNGPVGVDRSLHVAVDGGQGALAGILRQLVSMGAGNADDPAGNNLALPAPIRRFVDVRCVVVGVAGDQIHVLAGRLGRVKPVVDLLARGVASTPCVHGMVRTGGVGQRLVHADHDGADVGIRREIAVEHRAQPCQLCVRKLSRAGVVEGDEVDAVASPVIPGANGSSSRAVGLALGCNLRTVEIIGKFCDVAR